MKFPGIGGLSETYPFKRAYEALYLLESASKCAARLLEKRLGGVDD